MAHLPGRTGVPSTPGSPVRHANRANMPERLREVNGEAAALAFGIPRRAGFW
jgi:hypothetical protein